jgi:hypothetical protein
LTFPALFKNQTKIADHKYRECHSSTYLTLKNDGGIKLDTEDSGEFVTKSWGKDDYEYWVDVPAATVGKLAYELLAEKYEGDGKAVDKFRTWCEQHGVEHKFWTW